MMPPNGAAARADHSATLEVISHNKLIDPEVGRLLEAPVDGDEAALVQVVRSELRRMPPGHHVEEVRRGLALFLVLTGDVFVHGDSHGRHRHAAGGVADFGVAGQSAHQYNTVDHLTDLLI